LKTKTAAAAAARQAVETVTAAPEVAPAPPPAAAAQVPPAEKRPAALIRGYEELAQLGHGHFDAVVQANTVLAKGAEEIGRELMDYAQATLEQTAVTAKALLGARTFQDVVLLNSDFAKGSVERFLENSAKLSDLGARLATEAFEPLSARVTLTIEKMVKPAAA
jgi:phasin family protein